MEVALSMKYMRMTLIVSSIFAVAGCATPSDSRSLAQPAAVAEVAAHPNALDDAVQASQLEDKWGVKIEFATLSAGGYMVDFRFRVLDAVKAAPLIDRKIKPYLVDQSTGAAFAVPSPPKVGQLRSAGNVKEGTICFVYFANPGQYVKRGNRITVAIGDLEVRDILVQ